MAVLSQAVLKKRPGRIETFVNKVKNRSPFVMANGEQKIFNKIEFTDVSTGKIISLSPERLAHYTQAVDWLRNRTFQRGAYIMLVNDKERFTLSDVLKNAEFGGGGGGKGNRGDMAEAIFGAAIASRFINKNTVVTEQQVLKIINAIDPNRPSQTFEFESPNKNPKIFDKVTFQLNLSTSNLKALTDKTVQSTLADIIQSSVKYANSATVTRWSTELFNNNRYNTIDVLAIGTVSQTETKVDVLVKIDGKEVDINVSLKADDVKQFGQVGGSGFDKQEALWTKLIGMKPTPQTEKKYYKTLEETKDVVQALRVVYSDMADAISAKLNSRKEQVYDSLSDGIKYFATLNQKDVTLVQLSRQEAVVYNFDNLTTLLSTTKLTAKYIATKTYPEVVLVNPENEILFTVRLKLESKDTNYVRNYIEKGKLLTKLASYVAK